MRRIKRLGVGVIATAALTFGLAACGDSGGDGGSSGESDVVIRGTTDLPISLDPSGAYDLPSYDIIYNVYQNLVQFPPGETKPVPEAAESCEFKDDVTYECKMRPDNVFSDGSPLDAEDVVFSFERNVEIADPNGASSLLANMKSIEAPDKDTVVFHLSEPDATWPSVLATASFAIVPSDSYPPDKLQDDNSIIGSGRYTVEQYEPGQQTVMQANDKYTGEDPAQTKTAILQYFDKASALKQALEQGEVDVAYRSLSPTDLEDLKSADGVNVVQGEGAEIRYLNFNLDLQPGDDDAQKLAVRQAVAQTIDRQSIVDNVYNGTVKPLYSMIPASLPYHTDAFKDAYGDAPDVDAATKTLSDAGVKTPVPLEVWWTPSHYGPSSGDEYAEIKRQLDESGLFDVTLKSTEWNQYSEAAFTDKYPTYQLGWFPDYPDPDDYVGNFLSKTSFLNIHYNNPEVQKQLAIEKASTDDATRQAAFDKIQQISAEEAPNIPIWEGDQVAGVRDGVNGVEDTFDPAFIFRFWLITKD
jgi:peptide/nickel transport system substrate-binding protein